MASPSGRRTPGLSGAWTDSSPHAVRFVDANGVRLQCLDWGGSGPNLILIHGAIESPHLFDELAPAFTDRFRVVAYARRGHGRSDPKGPFDTRTLTEDLRGVMDVLGIGQAHLAGHSMGGNEITAMAGIYPDRVDRLVYLDAAYDWGDPLSAEAFGSLPSQFTEDTPGAMVSIDAYRASFSEVFPAISDTTRFEAWMRDTIVIQPDGSVRPTMDDLVNEALFKSLLSERRDYSQVHAPALAIYANSFWDIQTGDPTHVAENLAWEQKYLARFRAASIERTQRELPGVEILRVPGTHPDLMFSCRREIVESMRRFLGAR